MIRITTTLKRFDEQGEKTGWTYIEIPKRIAEQLKPGVRTTYRVKGKIDGHAIEQVSLIPMGEGNFIIAVNADMRKAIRKTQGASVNVTLACDDRPFQLNADFLACLEDEPTAIQFFRSLPQGHRNYFSKWIDSAKTEPTKIKRIAEAISALARKQGYGEMIRSNSKTKE